MNKLGVAPGQLAGAGIIRDKHGNIKGQIKFRGKPVKQEKPSGNTDAHKRGA